MTMNSTPLHRRNFLLHLQERPEYDGLVLLKEPAHEQLTRAQIAQLHNEDLITRQVAHVPGVRPVHAREGSESHPVLILEYIQGQSLSEIIQGQSLDRLQKLKLAVEIVGILARIHDQGVMHRDICSSNVMVAEDAVPGEPGGVQIIDFGLATTMRQEELTTPVSADAAAAVGAGSLAYISPEQTGRMNRPVDYRTDLYSLGVTLYDLLANRLPFEASDPLEMIHCHLAQSPVPLSEINPDIPQTLSDIVHRLLAKSAGDRYQSAHGLGADLRECLNQLQTSGRIGSFELGRDDFSERLVFSHNLYGRQSEIKELVETFDRAAQGNPELLFVAGYSGVGKTSLVHEIRRDVLSKQGIFIEGKFDQFQRTLPYSAWEQAFTQLVNHWLAESETDLAGWRETILEALGDNGEILIDIIPDLEQIIGPQSRVPELGGIENQNRFNYYFNRFVTALATPEHPLVVFLDDMQWIDLASLNLIEALFTAQETSCFLIIGAYRDNEVGADHPLVASQDRMRGESDRVAVISLGDLAPDDINLLLADSLQLTVSDCRPLSQILVEKTAGNPFYTRQLLYVLESDEILRLDRGQRRWVWDNTGLQDLEARDSVVDLMLETLQRLPVETQRTLSMAACVGSRFDMATLDTITGQPRTDILMALSPALQGGLIVQSNGHYTFSHDRIQEAGYALIPKSDLPRTHLQIGRLLLANTAAEDLEEEIFAIVGHLNAGRALIDADSEKMELAALNLKAGEKAKATAAFSDAKEYIEIGLDLLGPDSWQEQYELTLSLHNENGELASLTGQYDQIASIADLVHNNAKDILDQVRIYMTEIEAETAQYNFAQALEIGLNVLRDLGVEIPAQPTPEDNQGLYDRILDLLTSRSLERVAHLPEMSDEKALAASSLLASEMSTSYVVNPPLFPIITYLGAIFTLEFGLGAWSPFFLGNIPQMTFASIDHETPANEALELILFCKQLHKITREMLNNPVTAPGRTKGIQIVAGVSPWLEPIEKAIERAQATYRSGHETGDLLYGSYGILYFAMYGFAAGMNLDLYQSLLSEYTNSLSRAGLKATAQWLSIYLQAAQNFKEISPEPHNLTGTYLDEHEWLPAARAANDALGLHIFSINQYALLYHFDIDDKLDEYAGEIEDLLAGGISMFTTPLVHLYFALAKLRLIGGSSTGDHAETMNPVNNSLHLMEVWSQSVASTFRHKVDLIAAEKARVMGDLDGALIHYEQAIKGAQEGGFTHEEALANELYARFWAERDNHRFARQFMREAHGLYQKWGALAKAKHLEERYPQWLVSRGIIVDDSRTPAILDQMPGDLDLLTVLRASQDIASEIELSSLLDRMMTLVLENSGAQQGYLLLEQGGQWMIAAQAEAYGVEPRVMEAKVLTDSDPLAHGIVHYVARTQQTMVLEDAAHSGAFVQDPYVQRHQARSILCAPLINQGKTSGILYLENNLAPHMFTSQRVNLLKLLSSQMAISIDNARIHDHLEAEVAERTKELQAANQAKSLFLANMSHELRTPLNAILGFARLMARDVGLNAQQQERLKIINRSGEHLLDMVGDILTLSRIEVGRVGLSEETFYFRQSLEDIGRIFQSRAEGRGLRFNVELADDLPPYLLGDAGKLRQVLINLLDNAVKFTQEGDVWLRGRTQMMEEDPGKVMLNLEVEDGGPGIPQDHLDEIFETFVRYDHDQQTQAGAGLGLSISKSLVEMMGGDIAVESKVGQGSLFKVDIPMRLADGEAILPDELAVPAAIGLQPGQPEWRILVVDDNRENLLLLADLLAQAGFTVGEAENGAEAVAKFQDWRPHFIWMDVRMPGMDGYEATEKIRALPGGDKVKIVAVTASVIEDPQQVIQDTGVDDVVLKPFRDQEVFEVMARKLGVEYVYRHRPAAPAPPAEVELSAEMLADLPPDLLQELNQTTLVADREATLEVIERTEEQAPETAAGLRALVENFQMARLRDLLKEAETNHDS